MTRAVLVVNAGSATVKYALYSEALECMLHGTEEGADHAAMLPSVLQRMQSHDVVAAGHRVVHGGEKFTVSVRIDDAVIEHDVFYFVYDYNNDYDNYSCDSGTNNGHANNCGNNGCACSSNSNCVANYCSDSGTISNSWTGTRFAFCRS